MLMQGLFNAAKKYTFVHSKGLVEDCYRSLLKTTYNSSQCNKQIKIATTRRYFSAKQKNDSPLELVIFDKDGTLTCVSSIWGPWCIDVAKQLNHRTGLDVTEDAYSLFNYNSQTGRIGRGPLAENTNEFLRNKMRLILRDKHAMDETEAEKIIAEVWEGIDPPDTVTQVCDVKRIFSSLKAANIKIAVCTSDDRPNTVRTLNVMDVAQMVDYVLTGSDPHNVAKPAPDNVHLICSKLNVHPSRTAVIGDSPSDTLMGKESGAGLVIGVLTGVCNKSELDHADLVVENSDKALPYFLRGTLNID